jgi:hypothetical protein
MASRGLLALLLFTFSSSPTLAETFTVNVKAVDANWKPIRGAEAGLFWNVQDHRMTPQANRFVVTDTNGKGVLRVEDWNEKRPLLVLSPDRTRGAIVGVSKADDGKELTVTLGPTLRLKGKLDCTELKATPEGASTIVFADGFRAFFAQDMRTSAAFDFVLPAGKYKLVFSGNDVESAKRLIDVQVGRSEYDLGTIDLKATPMAKLRGKTPPEWVIADARGVKADVKLADQKGKWVYIEFWGFW